MPCFTGTDGARTRSGAQPKLQPCTHPSHQVCPGAPPPSLGKEEMADIFLLLPCCCPSFFPSEATLITFGRAPSWGDDGVPRQPPPPRLPLGEGKGPRAYNAWGGSTSYTGFSHPGRKTTELGQEATLKLPHKGLSPCITPSGLKGKVSNGSAHAFFRLEQPSGQFPR